MTTWGRLLTAMITPYDKDGNVDYGRSGRLAKHLLDNGSDGLVLWGTTAESPVLSTQEKENLFVAVKEEIENAGPLIVATGTNDTRQSVEQTINAQKLGADGVMVVVPYYNKPSQKGLYEHYKAVAESTDLPVMIYNIPGRSGTAIEVETTARLAELPNIVAIKESAGDVLKVTELRQTIANDFLIYSGDDALTLPMLSLGAHGIISVASHIASRPLKEMIEAFVAGDVQQAMERHEMLMPLFDALGFDVNPVPVKTMLDSLGFPTGGFRLPLTASEADVGQRVIHQLSQFKGNSQFLNSFLE